MREEGTSNDVSTPGLRAVLMTHITRLCFFRSEVVFSRTYQNQVSSSNSELLCSSSAGRLILGTCPLTSESAVSYEELPGPLVPHSALLPPFEGGLLLPKTLPNPRYLPCKIPPLTRLAVSSSRNAPYGLCDRLIQRYSYMISALPASTDTASTP